MIFIKDLPEVSRMTPWFADAFEDFFPIWLQSIVPYYKEARAQGCDILWLSNFKPMGATAELYEKDGIGYYLGQGGSFKYLGPNADYRYTKCDWKEFFEEMHPDYDPRTFENSSNYTACHNYLFRYFNRKPPYDVVTKRCSEYLQEITGDPKVLLSISSRSAICFDEKVLDWIEYAYKIN